MKKTNYEKETKRSCLSAALVVSGTVALSVVGIAVLPPLLKKCSNKIYKVLVKKDEIDFENLGPEIVRKEEENTEE